MSSNEKYPKTIIVCTTPFSPNNQSRAFDTYFHNWPKENLIQIFSSNQIPMKGICSSLYRITDADLFYNLFHFKKRKGEIFRHENLPDNNAVSLKDGLQHFKRKTWLRFYLRKALWGKKRWLNSKIEKWVDDFKPQMVFCGLSDDYFILEIAYYYSLKYSIPIVIAIGDDYYFYHHKNPFIFPYIKCYKSLFDKIMNTEGFAVYISDKIANKYNSFFKKKGFPIYLASEIETKPDSSVVYDFNYFGNLELGRYLSLAKLGDALHNINSTFCINVFVAETSKRIKQYLGRHHCVVKKAIPYNNVQAIMNSGSFNVIASGFRSKDIEASRYSLSTKVADALASSGPIIAIGPKGDGAIDYLAERNCAIVINTNSDLESLKSVLYDSNFLKTIVNNAHYVYKKEHDNSNNRHKFEEMCFKMISGVNNE